MEKEINGGTSRSNGKKAAVILGIIGSIASIIGLVYVFLPKERPPALQLTVMVEDEKGNVILENQGELTVDFGNDRRTAMIGEDGRTNFGEIPSIFMDSNIVIGFNVEGYEISNGKNNFVFKNKPIHLKVNRDNSLGIIKGLVKNRNGQEYIKGALIRINADTTVFSDSMGFFRIILPSEMRVKRATDGYKLGVSKEGYYTKVQRYNPLSSDAEIRLEKK